MKYEIQTRSNRFPDWSNDMVGDPNEFDTAEQAEAAIEDLKKLKDDDWRACEYRVEEIKGSFEPTHVITLDNGDRIEVQLVDGAGYTREEWESTSQADYERQDDGEWTFQGQPFAGTVRWKR